MKEFKFNITKKELKRALKFSKEHGTSEHKTITIKVSADKDIIEISDTFYTDMNYPENCLCISSTD